METCRLTLVNPGSSDSVLKIFPAEHSEEKIWLTEVKGIERWEMIVRNMNAFAERGTRVAKPVPYHADPKNLTHVTLKEEDIPTIRLDGWVLPKPPPEEKMPDFKTDPGNMLSIDKRISDLERMIGSLSQAVSHVINSKEPPKPSANLDTSATGEVPESKKRGRPRKVAQEA